jgi:2-polyprenyl-3-methyl-5-hydroxy-6-metoxy-1,4-benzoquinol methylase
MTAQPIIAESVDHSRDRVRPRLLIFVVAFQAESTIKDVLGRIPHTLSDDYDVEVLVIDDASSDKTFSYGREFERDKALPFPLTVLRNPINQGYGGNQKIGYCYARKLGFDLVALLHGDGQYAPACLTDLLIPLRDGTADACFGSRMMPARAALEGGMPLYKFVGNRILSWFQNQMLRQSFTEFHSGYRVYSVAALNKVPFDLNTNDFHFDTEIIVQFLMAGLRIVERPIPTYYGDEISRVNGMSYAWNVTCAVVKARLQKLGVFYDRRFDIDTPRANEHYQLKLDYPSPHALAFDLVPARSRVLDLGCAGGYLGTILKQRKTCVVAGVDACPLPQDVLLDGFKLYDLNRGLPADDVRTFDIVLMLDVIEHLLKPEAFVKQLRQALQFQPETRVLVSTANIGFIVTRLMLLLGQFNYGKRGILDLGHTRLFTFASLRRLFEQNGFQVIESRGVPAPFPLVAKGRVGRWLLAMNRMLIRISKGLFSYQIFFVVRPYPGLEYLLEQAQSQSES